MNTGPNVRALVTGTGKHIQKNIIPKSLFVFREAEDLYSF
jgi:hypothetical protein